MRDCGVQGPMTADVTMHLSDPSRVAVALTNTGGPYGGTKAKLMTGADLMVHDSHAPSRRCVCVTSLRTTAQVNVCAGTTGQYKVSARFETLPRIVCSFHGYRHAPGWLVGTVALRTATFWDSLCGA